MEVGVTLYFSGSNDKGERSVMSSADAVSECGCLCGSQSRDSRRGRAACPHPSSACCAAQGKEGQENPCRLLADDSLTPRGREKRWKTSSSAESFGPLCYQNLLGKKHLLFSADCVNPQGGSVTLRTDLFSHVDTRNCMFIQGKVVNVVYF